MEKFYESSKMLERLTFDRESPTAVMQENIEARGISLFVLLVKR